MSVRKAQSTLKSLESKGLIQKKQRKGRTDVYNLAPDLRDKLQDMKDKLEATRKTEDEDEDDLEV